MWILVFILFISNLFVFLKSIQTVVGLKHESIVEEEDEIKLD